MDQRGFDGAERPDFWLAHVRAGVVLTVLACSSGVVYVATDTAVAERVTLTMLLFATMGATVGLLLLPLDVIVTSRRAAWFFYGWSGTASLAVTAGCYVEGQSRSPFSAFYFLILVYAATAYPPGAVLKVSVGILLLYGGLIVNDAAEPGGNLLVAGCLALTAWMCSVAARNQWDQFQEQVQLAREDELTGCLNQRGFQEAFTSEVERANRLRRPLALLLVDLDEFKAVNDARGHGMGDAVLRRVGDLLRQSVRDVDVVGRVGGDEFAALLVETSGREALDVADRLCRRARTLSGTVTTFSIGVAGLVPGDTVASLLDAADAALYDAKRAGRDRALLHQREW
ncbi:GGDEF domain-containing protein [Actinomarinicola tropica]|uniref:Diguanylate cyclase n=1 Tax=Actinomarinicola tropica TaxID=2789776 RepID=A0A5Q2RJR8_9ACTN|nr:GGDEF domain-containing protein [Actinomarinicola tropica]QGG94287.1 diguanylate cyclase [Actinomarinicola tropica]